MIRSEDIKHDLGLLFAILVWGLNFAVIKIALQAMPAHAVNVFRFLISAIVLGSLYVAQQLRNRESPLAPLRRHGRSLVGLGLIGFLFYQLFFIIGVDHTTAGSAALIMGSSPLWTAAIGHVFRLDHLRRGAWIGLLATFAGTAVIVLGGTGDVDFSDASLFGNVMMLVAALLWGAYTAFNKPVLKHVSPTTVTFFGIVVALPFLTAIGIPYFDEVVWSQVDGWVWAAIVYSGGLSTGLAIAIWSASVRHAGPSQTAAFSNLVPVVGLLSGIVVLDETVTIVQILGGVLILGGLVVVRRHRKERALPLRKAA